MTEYESNTPEPSLGELALEDRASLRRVAGLSTELTDVSEVEYRQLRLERVVLVGVWTDGSAADADASLAELAALAETAGSEVLEGIIQRRDKPDPSTYIGSGKAQELRQMVMATGADTVICDGELSPAQLNALEKVVKVKVVEVDLPRKRIALTMLLTDDAPAPPRTGGAPLSNKARVQQSRQPAAAGAMADAFARLKR